MSEMQVDGYLFAAAMAIMAAFSLWNHERNVKEAVDKCEREMGPHESHEPVVRAILMGANWVYAITALVILFISSRS